MEQRESRRVEKGEKLMERTRSSFFSSFPTADSRTATLSPSSEKRTPDRRLELNDFLL